MADIRIPLMDLKPQVNPLKEELLAAYARVLDNTSFILGPDVEALEQEFGALVDAPHGVGVNSGTSALHLALLATGVEPGDEVIVPPFTFASTAYAVSYCGATPIFADILPDTFNIDPASAEKKITNRTKAIIGVHLFGQPCDMDELCALGDAQGVPVIEDAAQAHGALYKGRPVGGLGALACFSFYPSKNLGACGEGGMVFAKNPAHAERMRSLRNHGSTRRYYYDEVGYNYRMEGIQAAGLRVKLKHLHAWTSRRQQIAQRYDALFADAAVTRPAVGPDRTHVYHLYVLKHPRADAMAEYLAEKGIGTARHYPVPLHLQQAYEHLGVRAGSLPVSEQVAQEVLSIPMYAEMSDADVETVAEAVRGWQG